MTVEETEVLVIGAGPAGLMAAEVLASAGRQVVVADAMPSPARKFLMAGKSGLNLTKAEPFDAFLAHYGTDASWLAPALRNFGPAEVQDWAIGLGVKLFTGSTGRVFPVEMKASPLLRAWLARLDAGGVDLRRRWRWQGWQGDAAKFYTPDGPRHVRAGATILALGGASWARLGSNGHWAETLADEGVGMDPFAPSNVGLTLNWSPHMERFFGTPVKNISLSSAGLTQAGECVVTRTGLEGGGIYPFSPQARTGATITIDLLPDLSQNQIAARLARPRGKQSLTNFLRKALRLDPVKIALLREFGGNLTQDTDLSLPIKSLPLPYTGTRPMDEAISTAGGIRPDAMDDGFMLRSRSGVFCCGEMQSWDAPTGGYLLTACLATGRWAGAHAAEWVKRKH